MNRHEATNSADELDFYHGGIVNVIIIFAGCYCQLNEITIKYLYIYQTKV